MSLQQALAKKAENAYKEKDWGKACDSFDLYFRKSYTDEKKTFSIEDGVRLYQYADSLFNKISSEKKGPFDQEEVENIVDYVVSAQKTYNEATDKQKFPITTYFDTYILLGRLALEGRNYKQAQTTFTTAYQIANDNNLSWRDRLSSLFYRVIALENREMPKEAIDLIDIGLGIIEEEINKKPEEDTLKDLNDFRNDLDKKKHDLEDDLEEQNKNPDLIKNEEGNQDKEEEEEDENENEEEEEEEGNEKADEKEEQK